MSRRAGDTFKRRRRRATPPGASFNVVRSRDGTAIAFDCVGEGPPLILVDGALCHRAVGPSSPLDALLAPDFSVYTFDRRGRGASGDTAPYRVEREIEDLQALIDQAGGSGYVWGASSGAALALEAARRGAGVTKLALYEPPFIVDDSRPRIPTDIITQLNALVADDRRNDAVRLFLRHMGAPGVAIAVKLPVRCWLFCLAGLGRDDHRSRTVGGWVKSVTDRASP
jgi:pimeloyl-ACP methyl ester carboxylesterase